jgi:hypothetical protein
MQKNPEKFNESSAEQTQVPTTYRKLHKSNLQ